MPRPLSDFVRDARARGPYTAPQAVIEDAVRRTAIDLCTRAGVWRYDYRFVMQTNVVDYPLLVPEGTRVIAVEWVRINGITYQPAPGADCACQCGTMNIAVPNDRTIIVSPANTIPCDTHVFVKLWLAPKQDVCDLPDFMWEQWSDAIADGAASRLLQQPDQPYTNQGLSQKLDRRYQVWVTRAKNQRVMQRTTGPLRMTGSYF